MGLGRIIGGTAAGLGLVGLGVTGIAGEDNTTRDDAGAIVEGGEIGAFRIRLGDCLTGLSGDEVEAATGVPCEQAHDYEVYFAFNLPDGDYPGDTEVGDTADERCFTTFEPFVGAPYETSVYGYTSLLPTRESWESLDDREVLCMIGNYDGTQKTGTARGTGI